LDLKGEGQAQSVGRVGGTQPALFHVLLRFDLDLTLSYDLVLGIGQILLQPSVIGNRAAVR
jgi:hypothetical protein